MFSDKLFVENPLKSKKNGAKNMPTTKNKNTVPEILIVLADGTTFQLSDTLGKALQIIVETPKGESFYFLDEAASGTVPTEIFGGRVIININQFGAVDVHKENQKELQLTAVDTEETHSLGHTFGPDDATTVQDPPPPLQKEQEAVTTQPMPPQVEPVRVEQNDETQGVEDTPYPPLEFKKGVDDTTNVEPPAPKLIEKTKKPQHLAVKDNTSDQDSKTLEAPLPDGYKGDQGEPPLPETRVTRNPLDIKPGDKAKPITFPPRKKAVPPPPPPTKKTPSLYEEPTGEALIHLSEDDMEDDK